MTKKSKIFVIILILLVFVAGYFYFQNWWDIKELKIEKGLASDKFPWRDYTQEELAKMYPQIKYADVPTRVTPEETYAKFREALRTNNLEMAIEQLSRESKKYQENIDTLSRFYNEGKFLEIYNTYPEKIEKSSIYESIASYYFLEKKGDYNLRQYIGFSKDSSGDWKLDSL